jgi:hypothetical protein
MKKINPNKEMQRDVLLTIFITILFLPPGAGETAEIKFSAGLAHLLAFPLGWMSGWIMRKPAS